MNTGYLLALHSVSIRLFLFLLLCAVAHAQQSIDIAVDVAVDADVAVAVAFADSFEMGQICSITNFIEWCNVQSISTCPQDIRLASFPLFYLLFFF